MHQSEHQNEHHAEPVEYTGDELLQLPAEEQRLLDPFLRRTGLSCLAGSSDVGKSMLLRTLAIAVATGAPDFLGYPLSLKHQRALYVSTEDDPSVVAELLKKQAHGLSGKLGFLHFKFDHNRLAKALDTKLSKEPADLVIIDSFGDVFHGNVKDSQQVRRELDTYYDVCVRHKCQILFLHHTGKRTDDNAPSKHNLLGSQGFEAKMRMVFELKVDRMDTTLRHLCIVKANYLPAREKSESIVLKFDEETFTFHPTGDRVPLELLAKLPYDEMDYERYQNLVRLKSQGLKGNKLAEALGYASRAGVTELEKRFKDRGNLL